MTEEEKDIQKEMCIGQGYVPASCKLPGVMIYGLVSSQGNPCIGCAYRDENCWDKK